MPGIKKYPGENVTVTWNFLATDESKITGFRIYSSPASAGPYAFTGTTAAPTARQVVFPVVFSTGNVMVFYQVKAFYSSGSSTVESNPDPAAGAEVDMNVPMPSGVLVK